MRTTTLNCPVPDSSTDLTRRHWDVLVVGAGPAGSITARQLARYGLSVLLVDKARFPRRKVCGCCVGAAAVAMLERIGLRDVLPSLGAQPIRQLCLGAAGYKVPLSLDGGMAVSRDALDSALVDGAVEAGVCFQDGAAARLAGPADESWRIELSRAGSRTEIVADAVVAADGIYGGFLARESDCRRRTSGSRIGAGAMLHDSPDFFQPGTIYMAIGDGGYVGFVRLEDGSLNVAAALDKRIVASPPANRLLRPARLSPKPVFLGPSNSRRLCGMARRRWPVGRGSLPIDGCSSSATRPAMSSRSPARG